MILFLSWIVPWIRTSGWLERDEADRHRGEPGIVVGFRGPRAGTRGSSVGRGWICVSILVDGAVALEAAATHGSPRWCATTPGTHTVSAVPMTDSEQGPVECTVVVTDRPVIVAMWPKHTRFGDERPARIEPQTR